MSFNYSKYFIGVSLATVLAACGGNKSNNAQAGGPTAVSVTDTVIQASSVSYDDEYPGTTVAFQQVQIISQVTGYIKGIYFKDGQHVEKGQLLYRIDAEVYDANAANAKATVAVQEANLVKAKKDYDRYHQLSAQDAVAKQLVDNADAAYDAAKKEVAAAKATVRSMQSNVGFTELRAPYSGTIGISNVRVGTAVFAGTTILNTISTNNPMAVDINIDQSELSKFDSLYKMGLDIFQLNVGGPDLYPQKGRVSMIDRAADASTGTIKVRLSFPNGSDFLKPGMTASVVLPMTDNTNSTILIPQRALVEQLGEFYVYTIGDSSKVSQTHVVTGRQIGPNIIIKSGLSVGQHLVIDGVQNLNQGTVVSTASQSAAGAAKK